jgi:hypothetical protein
MRKAILLVLNLTLLVLLADQMIMILCIEGIVITHFVMGKTKKKIPTKVKLRKKIFFIS